MRAVQRRHIVKFLEQAILRAPDDVRAALGTEVTNIWINDSLILRVDLADGSIVLIDPDYLVPRDHFAPQAAESEG